METAEVQGEATRQVTVCNLWGGLLQDHQSWLGDSLTTKVHTRKSRYSCAHALYAAKAALKAVIVIAEDTYVRELCFCYNRDIPCSIYQKCETKKPHTAHRLASSLGDSICDALIGLHAFTGCDTVSALTGRGKLGALTLMKKDSTHQETFSQLGQSWEVSKQLFDKIQLFTCQHWPSEWTALQTLRSVPNEERSGPAILHHAEIACSSCLLPSINLEVLPLDSAICGRPKNWRPSGHRVDAHSSSPRCSFWTVVMQVPAFMQTAKLHVHCQWTVMHQHVQATDVQQSEERRTVRSWTRWLWCWRWRWWTISVSFWAICKL